MDFGAKKAGASIIFSNDVMPDACATLRKYFPNTHVYEGDIAEIESYPAAELVIGGYPCQSFSIAGNRNPKCDARTFLYQHYVRCLDLVQPKYFLAENVDGLQKLKKGKYLEDQIKALSNAGEIGYEITCQKVDAKEYGVPQTRKRVLIVGVRKDLGKKFVFPQITHGIPTKKLPHLKPYTSHGQAIRHLPLWPDGEFYERLHDPEGHWSWYYMSRNRKKPWTGPAFTVVANWRHITLHPAGPIMTLTWSDLKNGWKQRWDFSEEYDQIDPSDPDRPILKSPRRLSWRECAAIQTFPKGFEPEGSVESKFTQIGNAVPPLLAEIIIKGIISGEGLVASNSDVAKMEQLALF